MEFNQYQTPLTEELLDSLPKEVRDQLIDIVSNVEFVKRLIDPNRSYAKDRPRDDSGKIVVDLVNPHILEDMDYFRPSAIHYEKYGCFTKLRPNSNPNSAFRKWLDEEIRRCWEGYVRESDGEWVTGYLYYFLNYSPMMLSKIRESKNSRSKRADRVEALPECWEGIYWRFHCMDQAANGGLYNNFEGGQNMAELASRGKGKAHPYSQKVLTKEGWTTWGNIQIDSILYDEYGNYTKVIDIPYDEESDIYEITLQDNRKIQCTDGHLFKVLDTVENRVKILSLKEILSNYKYIEQFNDSVTFTKYRYSIPNNGYISFGDKEVSIDPYTLGVLLNNSYADLNQENPTIRLNSYRLNHIKDRIPYRIIKRDIDNRLEHTILLSRDALRKSGLYRKNLNKRYIPEEYLYNNTAVRIQLVQGILDSTGYIKSNGVTHLNLHSHQLKEDLEFLLRSLGISISSREVKLKTSTYYSVRIFGGGNLFTNPILKTNSKNLKNSIYSRRVFETKIVDIKYSHREKAKCITVDNPSSCYLIGDFIVTHNSYSLASILSHIFILGENREAKEKVKGIVTAYQKEYLIKDGVLNKFLDMANFCASTTQFPRKRLKDSIQELTWTMGYKDAELGIDKGTLNTVLGVSSKDDESKLRGKRAAKILVEEYGSFPRLLDLYNVLLPSVQEGDIVFGQIVMVGTAGDKESDFAGAQEIMYHPKGYNMYSLPNVFDKNNQGKPDFVFFFPGYINRKGCYNKDGVSDVIKALIEILLNRHRVKYNSSDPNTLMKTIAEIPITPAEAILKVGMNMFPVTDLTERLLELDSNPTLLDQLYQGDLILLSNGEIEYKPSENKAIREFPHKDNKNMFGAVEIIQMPELDRLTNKPYANRYIGGIDPYDDDSSNTTSLGSIFILDLWTDKIVAEYTGRPLFAEDFYEICRRLGLFYNARLNYENNKKGLFSYFSKNNCLYLLTDQLEFLKDKQMVKAETYGNKLKGTIATPGINSYGRTLLRAWLLKPNTTIEKQDNNEVEVKVPSLYSIYNRAFLKELVNYNDVGNFDRISAMGMLMLLREDRIIAYRGDLKKAQEAPKFNILSIDPFFENNYNRNKSLL